jgi:uncharacterized protein
MRLLIFLGLIYLGYRALKSWMLQGEPPRSTFDKTGDGAADLMIKDPFCEVYFPKKDGIHLNVNGEDLYFCSEECRDKFIASHKDT